jgi:dTDP-4-amino-4,6-dideoxygalactose transaminase
MKTTMDFLAEEGMERSEGTHIPFNWPGLVGRELEYLQQAVVSGHIAGDGQFTRKCQSFLEAELGVAKALLTSSCSHALEMAAILLDIKAGDEVIVPSFTFVTSANAFVLRGAKPVFADIRPDTLNLDETKLERLVSPRTKAIVVVHYAGVGCELDTILEIARRCKLPVVEDNAHGLFARYKGKFLGTFGDLAMQSFHETKNFSCGEGGALLVNQPSLIERAEIVREKGTDRSRFFRGQVDKYGWVDIGSSYLPSDILAAYLWGQLESREQIQKTRRRIWMAYRDGLDRWSQRNGVRLPVVPAECEQSYHMFYILLPNLAARQGLIAWLKQRGISAVFHYLPLHSSKFGRTLAGQADCPVTTDVSDRLLRLPLFNALGEPAARRVIEAVSAFDV